MSQAEVSQLFAEDGPHSPVLKVVEKTVAKALKRRNEDNGKDKGDKECKDKGEKDDYDIMAETMPNARKELLFSTKGKSHNKALTTEPRRRRSKRGPGNRGLDRVSEE